MTDKPLVSDLQLDEAHIRLTANGALREIVRELKELHTSINESVANSGWAYKLTALIELGEASIEGTPVHVAPYVTGQAALDLYGSPVPRLPIPGEALSEFMLGTMGAAIKVADTLAEIKSGEVWAEIAIANIATEYCRSVPTAEGGLLVPDGRAGLRYPTRQQRPLEQEDPSQSENPDFTEFLETYNRDKPTGTEAECIALGVTPRTCTVGEYSEAELAEMEAECGYAIRPVERTVNGVVLGVVVSGGTHNSGVLGDLTPDELTAIANSRTPTPAIDAVVAKVKDEYGAMVLQSAYKHLNKETGNDSN